MDFFILSLLYSTPFHFICRRSDSPVSEDAGIEPRTVATLALAVRRSNHSARSHPQIRLDLIQTFPQFSIITQAGSVVRKPVGSSAQPDNVGRVLNVNPRLTQPLHHQASLQSGAQQ